MTRALTSPGKARPRRRWTTAEFERLVAAGVIREGSRTYLWDGEVIEPMPEDQPHVNAVENLRDLLAARLTRDVWTINQGKPVRLSDGFLPQPDLSVLYGPRSTYRGTRQPTAADVALLVEVSDSTYPDDAGDYLRRYAMEGIPQYGIVNIRGRRIEVYTSPQPDASGHTYILRNDFAPGTRVPLVLTFGGVASAFEEIDVLDVLRDSLDDDP